MRPACWSPLRALVAVMSCGICAASKTSEQAEALCKDVMSLLVEQMAADYPKISAMKAKGERNEYILPERIM
jgi:hypothetical protein